MHLQCTANSIIIWKHINDFLVNLSQKETFTCVTTVPSVIWELVVHENQILSPIITFGQKQLSI